MSTVRPGKRWRCCPVLMPLESRTLLSVVPVLGSMLLSEGTTTPLPPDAHVSLASDGSAWVTVGTVIERVTPDGAVTQFTLPADAGAAVTISSAAVFTSDNSAWFVVAGSGNHWIERLSPSGQFSAATTPTQKALGTIAGGGTAVWFTQGAHTLAEVGADGGHATVDVQGVAAVSALGVDLQGNAWFGGETNGGGGILGSVTVHGASHLYAVSAIPTTIAIAPDGDLDAGGLGVLWQLSANGTLMTTALPGFVPTVLASGAQDALWFVAGSDGASVLGGWTLAGGVQTFSLPITGGTSVQALTVAGDGSLQFAGISKEGLVRGALAQNGGVDCVALADGSTLAVTAATSAVVDDDAEFSVSVSTSGLLSGMSVHTLPVVCTKSVPRNAATSIAPVAVAVVATGPSVSAASPLGNPSVFEGEFRIAGSATMPEESTPRQDSQQENESLYPVSTPAKAAWSPGSTPDHAQAPVLLASVKESTVPLAGALDLGAHTPIGIVPAPTPPAPVPANATNLLQRNHFRWSSLTLAFFAGGHEPLLQSTRIVKRRFRRTAR